MNEGCTDAISGVLFPQTEERKIFLLFCSNSSEVLVTTTLKLFSYLENQSSSYLLLFYCNYSYSFIINFS